MIKNGDFQHFFAYVFFLFKRKSDMDNIKIKIKIQAENVVTTIKFPFHVLTPSFFSDLKFQ